MTNSHDRSLWSVCKASMVYIKWGKLLDKLFCICLFLFFYLQSSQTISSFSAIFVEPLCERQSAVYSYLVPPLKNYFLSNIKQGTEILELQFHAISDSVWIACWEMQNMVLLVTEYAVVWNNHTYNNQDDSLPSPTFSFTRLSCHGQSASCSFSRECSGF